MILKEIESQCFKVNFFNFIRFGFQAYLKIIEHFHLYYRFVLVPLPIKVVESTIRPSPPLFFESLSSISR